MTAELRRTGEDVFVVDVACGIEEDWGADTTGAAVRVDEHNEAVHPVLADPALRRRLGDAGRGRP